jgi:CheY-like chemotaxis protein
MQKEERPILLVEDDHEDAHFFEETLRECGFQNPFHVVHTAEEAIKYLGAEGPYANRKNFPWPYLVVLDVHLPGRTGWEVLSWMRERPESGKSVVLILGGSGSVAEEDMAHRLGVNGYHPKPQTAPELRKLVTRIGQFWLKGPAIVEPPAGMDGSGRSTKRLEKKRASGSA